MFGIPRELLRMCNQAFVMAEEVAEDVVKIPLLNVTVKILNGQLTSSDVEAIERLVRKDLMPAVLEALDSKTYVDVDDIRELSHHLVRYENSRPERKMYWLAEVLCGWFRWNRRRQMHGMPEI